MRQPSRLAKILLSALTAWSVFLITGTHVSAEPLTRTVDIAMIRESGTYLFSIGWDRGDLITTLIDPAGTRIAQDNPPPGVSVASRSGITVFRVDRTMPGLWQAECVTDQNGRVAVITQRLIQPLYVRGVVAMQDGQDALKVQFSLDGEPDRQVHYRIYLTTDGRIAGGRLLHAGTAMTGDEISQIITTPGVGSCLAYQIVVYATCEDGAFTDFHEAVSAPFPYEAPDSPPPVEKLQAILLPYSCELSWSVPPELTIDGYLVAVYTDDQSEPVYADRLSGDISQTIIPMPAEWQSVRIEAAQTIKGITGLPAVLTLHAPQTFESMLQMTLPEQGSLHTRSLIIPYDAAEPTQLLLTLNGSTERYQMAGEGQLSMQLAEGLNKIRFLARVNDQLFLAADRWLYADTIAPVLRLYDDPDGRRTTASQILIAGHADDAVRILVNDQTAEKDNFGNFRVDMPLATAVNHLTIMIADRAGNSTQYAAIIYRVEPKARLPWILIIGLPLMIVFAVMLLLCYRKRRARK